MIQCILCCVTMLLILVSGCTHTQQTTEWTNEPAREFTVTNPTAAARTAETISLDWEEIAVKEKEWMRMWDETVKGRGKEVQPGE